MLGLFSLCMFCAISLTQSYSECLARYRVSQLKYPLPHLPHYNRADYYCASYYTVLTAITEHF